MLGDVIEKALSSVGITTERVERWLGTPCGCEGRKYKLNALGNWVGRVLMGKIDDAGKHLDGLMDDGEARDG